MNQADKIIAAPADTPVKTGELLIREGLVRAEDIETALAVQHKRQNAVGSTQSRLLGMILCDLNLITPLDNYHILHKHSKLHTIESELVSSGLLGRDAMEKTRARSLEQDIPFISLLLKTGQVSISQMQKILFNLFHVPFRSISDFIFNEQDRSRLVQILGRQRSAEQKIIPLVFKDNTILFGITDPSNMLTVRQLNEQFPQYRFKTLFIPYSGFSWFSKIVYKEAGIKIPQQKKTVDLSLLLNFKTTIKDPEIEKEAVWILYERYELLRRLSGKAKRGNFQDEFNRFILKTHKEICTTYQSTRIEYSLEKDGARVSVAALPLRPDSREGAEG